MWAVDDSDDDLGVLLVVRCRSFLLSLRTSSSFAMCNYGVYPSFSIPCLGIPSHTLFYHIL